MNRQNAGQPTKENRVNCPPSRVNGSRRQGAIPPSPFAGQFRQPMGWWTRACPGELRPCARSAQGAFWARAERRQ